MPNVWGEADDQGLTNPLTEDIQGADFNILDINELHINELHDQDGIDKIRVHEDFNMLNNQITNMADPIQNKDAVTLQYFNNNLPSIPPQTYDIAGAVSDETTPISVGIQTGSFVAPRTFTCNTVICYLRTGAAVNNYAPTIYVNGSAIVFSTFPDFITAGDTVSQSATPSGGSITVNAGSVITVGANTDTTAAGLKVALLGQL